MGDDVPRLIALKEGEPTLLPRTSIDESLAIRIYKTEGVVLEFPSPATDFCYRLLSPTTVGQIPIGNETVIRIVPKVPVANIFRMLEVAYNLDSFRLFQGAVPVNTLDDLIERLASILSRRILDRARRGLYRGYIEESGRLACVRGRLNIRETTRLLATGAAAVHCDYQEQTADLEENQILLWTLSAILQLNLRRQSVIQEARAARRVLLGTVSLKPFHPFECVGRMYNRLNHDYEPLHGICRFFLENSGPGINQGEHHAIPFTVNMPRLFELFVSEWLRKKAPTCFSLKSQHKVDLDSSGRLSFKIDIVVFDAVDHRPLAVLDTKYKGAERTSEQDIQQILAYAGEMGVTQAYLIYPSAVTEMIDVLPSTFRRTRVRSLVFDLGGDIDAAGGKFLDELIGQASSESATALGARA